MNNVWKTLGLIALLCVAPASHAAQGLYDIYRLALDNDPQIAASDAARRALRETRPQVRARLLPSINFNADAATNDQERTRSGFIPNVAESFTSRGYTLSVRQPVFRYDLYLGLDQADARVAQAETDYAVAEQDLIVRVAQAYFNVQDAIDNLIFARAEKSAVERQLEQAKQRFDVGLIAITDVHEAQARYDQTVADEILAVNQLANAREALQEVTGEYPGELAALRAAIPLLTPEPDDIDQWAQLAEQQNLQLISARYGTEIARQEIGVQRAGHLPTLDLVASSSNSLSNSQFGSETDSDQLALEFNLPIYSGGAVSSRTREARFRFTESQQLLIQSRRSVLRQAREAYLGVRARISSVNALRQAVVSSEKALEATRAGFDVGTRTVVDVLLAEREVYRNKRSFARARYDYILETLRLKRAAGTLGPGDVQAIDGWLQR